MKLQEIADIILNHFDGLQSYIDEAVYYDEDDYNEDQLLENINILKSESEAQWCESGATKFVFGFTDLPGYVVKIPFRGCRVFEETDDFDDEYLYYMSDDKSFSYAHADPTHGDLHLENDWDYCEAEEKIYAAAPDCIKNVLVKTTYVCSIGDNPIYVSEEMISEFNWEDAGYTSKKSQDLAHSIANGFYSLTEEILSVIIEQQGIQAANELVKFIKEYGLNDFHAGNLMYDDDSVLKFIDYAGYNE